MWQKIPYFLKGGIIGILPGLFAGFFISSLFEGTTFTPWGSPKSFGDALFEGLSLGIIFFFILGSIFGLIYGFINKMTLWKRLIIFFFISATIILGPILFLILKTYNASNSTIGFVVLSFIIGLSGIILNIIFMRWIIKFLIENANKK